MNTKVAPPNVVASLALIDALKPGEHQEVHHVSWEEYEELLGELGEWSPVRLSFTDGALKIMAPLFEHENPKEVLSGMARLLARRIGLKLQNAGSTTFKRKDQGIGREPDTCFYIQNAQRIIGKRNIDLKTDPPPDIVVEIDVTHLSGEKFGSYAKLGVPELWLYDGMNLRFYERSGDEYVERQSSLAFPFISASELNPFLELNKSEGQDAALEAFHSWLLTR